MQRLFHLREQYKRLLYVRRLEQLGLSGSVSVTERDPGDGGPAPPAGPDRFPHEDMPP